MKENKQVKRSKKWMHQALLDLLEKKPFSSISILNIVEKADVARLTFYRNYKSKEDMVIQKGKEICDDILNQFRIENCTSFSDSLSIIANIFSSQSRFFHLLLKNNLEYLVLKSFEKEVEEIFRSVLNTDFKDVYELKFYVGAFSSVVFEWFKNEKNVHINELENILVNLFQSKVLINGKYQ